MTQFNLLFVKFLILFHYLINIKKEELIFCKELIELNLKDNPLTLNSSFIISDIQSLLPSVNVLNDVTIFIYYYVNIYFFICHKYVIQNKIEKSGVENIYKTKNTLLMELDFQKSDHETKIFSDKFMTK
jgi:hypothetical protein